MSASEPPGDPFRAWPPDSSDRSGWPPASESGTWAERDAFGSGFDGAGWTAAEPVHPTVSTPVASGRRGHLLARGALLLAVVMAVLLGISCFLTLASIELVSTDPLGEASIWLVLLAVATVGGLAALALAVVALIYCRPRVVACLATATAVVLPILAVLAGTTAGVEMAKLNFADDLRQDPAAAADYAIRVMDQWQVDAPVPVRDLIRSIADLNGE